MNRKIILITGTSGFIGKKFLEDALSKKYYIIDILRHKNKTNRELNQIRKKFSKNYKSIFYKNYEDIKIQLKSIKADYFINFATLYKNNHIPSEISKFVHSNILFPTIILDAIYLKTKKIINFGSMMQHMDGKDYLPMNFYASTKSAFEMIINFYALKNRNLKFYNLKLYESFSEDDKRSKLIPTLLKNYKKNLKTPIYSKKLELNIIHTNDIIKSIYIILKNNIKSGSYCLKQSKNTKIFNLINKINKKLDKKIKVEFMKKKFNKLSTNKIRLLKNWKPEKNLEEKIINRFLYENY